MSDDAEQYILAIDQGTTSSRAIVFDHSGAVVSVGQKEHAPDPPPPGLGRARPAEIWSTCARSSARRSPARHHAPFDRARSASRTSARRPWCGMPRPASGLRTRSSGKTRARSHRRPSCPGWRPRPLPRRHRTASQHLLRRHEDRLDPRERRRRPRAGRARRAPLRHDRHLGALEPHRRSTRRRPCDGCHEREPHAACSTCARWSGTCRHPRSLRNPRLHAPRGAQFLRGVRHRDLVEPAA
jgi:hypothetical protein